MSFKRYNFQRSRSRKVKKIFLIVFLLLAVFFLFFMIKNIVENNNFNEEEYKKSTFGNVLEKKNKTIFNIKELNIKELENRIILLNVYNIKDFSYIFSLDLASQLQKEFNNKLVIIDVVTDEIPFDNDIIINYIIKNNIERPIINIANLDLKDLHDEKNSRYFTLIDTNGMVVNKFSADKKNEPSIVNAVNNLIAENPKINTKKLNISLEKNNNPESFIKSLNQIKYIHRIKDTNDGPYFLVADINGRRIYLMTINGNIINQIGSGKKGKDDGMGINALFCKPSGLAVEDNEFLYVADICNNSIRKVDLKTLKVSTLIEDDNLLKNPIDLEVFNDKLIITTASNDFLLSYDLNNENLNKITCEACDKYIVKLKKFNDKVYFIGTKDYGLYSVDQNDNVIQEINFDELNKLNDIKLVGNNNFHIDETGFYFVDKFNDRILRVYENKTENYSFNINSKEIYDLPMDIVDYRDKFYITNERNKKLVKLDRNTKNNDIINISFGYEYNKLKLSNDKFLDINNLKELNVKSGIELNINIKLNNGYTFEKMAPQNLSLYKEDLENHSAILIKNYSKSEILKNKQLKVSPLDDDSIYYLKGSFYYCNYDKKTPCLINKYNKKIITDLDSKNTIIDIDFIYAN